MRRFLVVAAGVAALGALAAVPGGAASSPQFTLIPDELSMSTTAGTITYADVTVTNRSKDPLVIQNPATSDNAAFFDTQSGSCWQSYEVSGNPIPGRTSCTIQVGFYPLDTGTSNGTLTVSRCSTWHPDASSHIVCDTLDGSRTVDLTGTGT